MDKTVIKFYFILLHNLNIVDGINFLDRKGNLPDPLLISRMLNKFIRPMINYLRFDNPTFRTFEESEVEKVIREKIEELQPLLQDNDEPAANDNLLLESKDETTIIEFLPKTDERNNSFVESDAFKTQVKKYKKIKEKINRALTKESVSEKTKHLVIKTLDELINSAVKSQCKWKRNLRAERNGESSYIASKWNKGLKEIKKLLLSFFTNRSSESRRNTDSLRFLDAIQTLFGSITEDIDIISKKYQILCDFVPKNKTSFKISGEINSSALRNNWEKTDLEEDRCYSVVICSNELAEFLRNFYQALNDTAVSVLNNYVQMYTRDVNVDNEHEKHMITSLLNKITKDLNDSINKIFIKELYTLKLDKRKNRDTNIKVLSDYVKNSVASIKAKAKEIVKSELLILRDKVLSVIMDDLNVNLEIELGNLKREFVRKICTIFRICNGKYRGRRQGSDNNTKNNVYVQLQLTLHDNITDLKSYRKLFDTVTAKANNLNTGRFNTASNITVTRTTHSLNFQSRV